MAFFNDAHLLNSASNCRAKASPVVALSLRLVSMSGLLIADGFFPYSNQSGFTTIKTIGFELCRPLGIRRLPQISNLQSRRYSQRLLLIQTCLVRILEQFSMMSLLDFLFLDAVFLVALGVNILNLLSHLHDMHEIN